MYERRKVLVLSPRIPSLVNQTAASDVEYSFPLVGQAPPYRTFAFAVVAYLDVSFVRALPAGSTVVSLRNTHYAIRGTSEKSALILSLTQDFPLRRGHFLV